MKQVLVAGLLLISTRCGAQQLRLSRCMVEERSLHYNKAFSDVFSQLRNPASLTFSNSFSVGLHTERKFLLPELSHYVMAGFTEHAGVKFGFSATRAGFAKFSSSSISPAIALDFGMMSVGLALDYLRHKAGISANNYFGATIGAIVRPNANFCAGITLIHPTNQIFKSQAFSTLPFGFEMGLGYEVSEVFSVNASIEKLAGEMASVIVASGCSFAKKIRVLAAVAFPSRSIQIAGCVFLGKMQISIATSYHQYLGITPGSGFIYNSRMQ